MESLYVNNGWSFGDIARRYQTDKGSVWNAMKRDATRLGRPWPLQQAQVNPVERYGYNRGLASRLGTTSNELIAAEIADMRDRGVTLKRIAARAGIDKTLLWKHASRYRTVIARDTARRIMKAITEIEKELTDDAA